MIHTNPWAALHALLDNEGGYLHWPLEHLVRYAGSQRAGARVVERIERELAENGIGHLPGKLTTEGGLRVLLYPKTSDSPTLMLVRLVHELAAQPVSETTPVKVEALELLLNALTKQAKDDAPEDQSKALQP
ncbi:hypothetical protein ACWDXD_24615 [Streptomyces sp. NPDC003314]